MRRDVAVRTGLSHLGGARARAPAPARRGGGRRPRRSPSRASAVPAHEHVRRSRRGVRAGAPRRRVTSRGPASLDPTCFLLDGGDPARLPGFDEGWFAVQDQASAFVVRALDPQPGDRVLDACAAPGGKAALRGMHVVGPGRPRRGGRPAPRSGRADRAHDAAGWACPALVLAQDATAPGPPGFLRPDPRRRSVLRARLGPAASGAAVAHQAGRAEQARSHAGRDRVGGGAELLAPGGRLIYSVCTFPRAETDAAADAIVRHAPRPASPRASPVPTARPTASGCGRTVTAATACSSRRSARTG